MNDRKKNGSSGKESRKTWTALFLHSKIKIVVTLILTIGISVSLYKVVEGTYVNRRPIQFSPARWVDLDKTGDLTTQKQASPAEKASLRIGVAPIVSPEKSIEMYQDFVNYLSEKMDRTPDPLYRQSYAETNELVRYRQCDVAIVCTYPFIRGEREFGMQALVVPQVRGETTYSSMILVPRSSKASSLLDLRGKRFASADVVSTTGWLFPALWLMQQGEDPNHFFGEHMISGSHDRSLQAVINGYVDGAAVHSLVYHMMTKENPDIADKVKILENSPPFGIPPIVANPALDPEVRNQIVSVLLEMHKDDRGRKILDALQIDRFLVPEPGHFDALRQDVAKLEGWR